jgi:hypothetical protein
VLLALLAIACPAQWVAARGELAVDAACRGFILATDAQDHAESEGDANWKQPLKAPYSLRLRWRRLGPEASHDMWLQLLGAHLVFKTGQMSIWTANERDPIFVRKLPGFSPHDEHRLEVKQTRAAIQVSLDGAKPFSIPLPAPDSPGPVGVGLNGARGYRSRLWFGEAVVRSQ